MTIVAELLHGQYIQEFDKNVFNKADIFVHAPSRAHYDPTVNGPSNPSRYAFVSLLYASTFSSLEMPLNMPQRYSRIPGTDFTGLLNTYYKLNVKPSLENQVLIGRSSRIEQSDPAYQARYRNRMRDLFVEQSLADDMVNATVQFNDFAQVPNVKSYSDQMYPVPYSFEMVSNQNSWWTSVDTAVSTSGANIPYLGLPYLPFFSNCKGSDHYLSLNKMLETDPSCSTVDYESTVPVTAFFFLNKGFVGFFPTADTCNTSTALSPQANLVNSTWGNSSVPWLPNFHGALYECVFEEQIEAIPANPRWYEAGYGTVLFHIANNPFGAAEYEPVLASSSFNYYWGGNPSGYSQYWGRSPNISNIALVQTSYAIPVVAGFSSTSAGYQGAIPRQVIMTIWYYQRSKGSKRIFKAYLQYAPDYLCTTLTNNGVTQRALEAQGIPQCTLNAEGKVASYEYQLEVYFLPRTWQYCMNYFQFQPPLYFLFFAMAGFFQAGMGAFLYIFNRLLTRLRHPPRFHGWVFLTAISFPAFFGCILGVMPIFIGCLIIFAWFPGSTYVSSDSGIGTGIYCDSSATAATYYPYQVFCFSQATDWNGNESPGSSVLVYGRKGLMLIFLGFLVQCKYSEMAAPNYTPEERRPDTERAAAKEKKKKDIKEKERRGEMNGDEDDDDLPESTGFKPHIWQRAVFHVMTFFTVFVAQTHMELSYSSPFASYCTYFIISFKIIYILFDIWIFEPIMVDVLYFAPLDVVFGLVQNMATMGASNFTQFLLSFVVGLLLTCLERLYAAPLVGIVLNLWPRWTMMLQRRLRGSKRMTREDKAKEELEWRKVNEEIELVEEGIEPMLDSFTDYAIDTAGTFTLPFAYIMLSVFYEETQIAQLYNILKVQMIYYYSFAITSVPFQCVMDVLLHNSNELIHGWKIYDYVAYQRYRFTVREYRWALRNNIADESIPEGFQKLDLLCFSSQFYFLLCFAGFGIFLYIFGISTVVRYGYNPLSDMMTIPIFCCMVVFTELMVFVCAKLADVQVRRIGWRGLWSTKQIEGKLWTYHHNIGLDIYLLYT